MGLAAFLAGAGGCTTLDVLDTSPPEGLPLSSDVPRWNSGLHDVSITSGAAGWRVTTDLPRRTEDCLAGDEPSHICADLDFDGWGDGLTDTWENMILEVLRPELRFGGDEHLFIDPQARIGSVGHVWPEAWPDGDGTILVFIVLAYSRDYGSCSFTEHAGDLERVVLRLQPLPGPGGSVDVVQVYTSAHEGTSVDHGATHDPADLRFITDEVNGRPRWMVFVSEGKHALYATPDACRAFADAPCVAEGCPSDELEPTRQLLVPVHHAGEAFEDDSYDPAFDSGAWPWPFPGEWLWGVDPFCGDVDPGSGVRCAPDLATKLLLDPLPSWTP